MSSTVDDIPGSTGCSNPAPDAPKITAKTNQKTSNSSSKFNHQCENCGKRFTRAATLRDHSRAHRGQRPYVCPQCPKAFVRSKDRTRHQILHTETKKFMCGAFADDWGCGRAFAREDGLVAHLRSEGGWGCVRGMLLTDRRVSICAENYAKEDGEFRCRLTPGACRRRFDKLDELLDHVGEAANKACIFEYLINMAQSLARFRYDHY